MIGTNIAPCVEGSIDIVSCYEVVSGDEHAGDVDVWIVSTTSHPTSCRNSDVKTLQTLGTWSSLCGCRILGY